MSEERSCRGCVVFDPSLTDYNFGPSHPMNPVRVDLTMQLAGQLGVVGDSGLVSVVAPHATDADLLTVHTPELVEAVQRSSADPSLTTPELGVGTDDNPTFEGMHEASRHIVGASLEAARRVWTGQVDHAANVSGGLHHAMPDRASGFCVYNDIAVAIRWLLAAGAERVAYVDVDVHHGDGVQQVFWDDPRVLTISLHETGEMLFPGTGFAHETGGPQAEGSAVNVALPAGTKDAGWLRAFHAVVPPLLAEFRPSVLITQQGCDTHAADPLAHMSLSIEGQRAAYLALHDLAHQVADGKWLAVGGGGYAVVDVVPRAWTHLLGIVGNRPVATDVPTPDDWRSMIDERLQMPAPLSMGDGQSVDYPDFREGYDPGSALDRAIMATRNAVFPTNGLDPLP